MKIVAIVGNGKLSTALLKGIRKADYIIGVDRAAHWLIIHGLVPNVAVGDFDSTSARELNEIKKKVGEVIQHPAEKDFTDLELAVELAIARKAKEVVIYGGVGSRLDHSLATIYLLERFARSGVASSLVDTHNRIMFLLRGRTILERGEWRYLSIIPHKGNVTVSLSGMKYPLVRHEIHHGTTLGISNEILGKQAAIQVHQGTALVIQSRD